MLITLRCLMVVTHITQLSLDLRDLVYAK